MNDFRGKNLEVKKKADDNTPEDLNRLFLFDLIYYFGLSREDILDLLKYPLHFTNQKVSAEFSENLFKPKKFLQIRSNVVFNSSIALRS